jgi:hypothetical protein
MIHMIWSGCFEKLLEVIYTLSCLASGITRGSGNKLLIKVVSVLIVTTLITAGGDYDSLGPLFWPPLVASGTSLCTLVSCCGRSPPTAAWSHFPAALYKNGPNRFLARGLPGGEVEKLFCGLGLLMTELVHKGSIVCARPEH